MNSTVKYQIVPAKKVNIDVLIKYKLNIILEYADDLDEKEIIQIKNYVNDIVPKLLKNYKVILIDNNTVGSILFYEKDDGILLDEIYIEEKYRNCGIGTEIIKNILEDNFIVYLWVYKLNIKAIKLYKRLGFKINEETETRYHMKYIKQV